jgi:DNA-binding NtrC family response regulator
MDTRALTILIVDDDPQILELVESMLKNRHVEVLRAPKASEALTICESRTVHLLISDIMMPEMDGNKLAERVMKLQPHASVLLISGYHKSSSLTGKYPQVRFLHKPFFPSDLLAYLRELLPEF